MTVLKRDFYERDNVVQVAKDLVGKVIHHQSPFGYMSARITEVEAYCGRNDKACHANNGKRSVRTEVMYGKGGYAYIYLCYGIHHLFNIVTNQQESADAVLIRAVEPIEGLDLMLKNRNLNKIGRRVSSGPGVLSQAMGLNYKMSGMDLCGEELWLSDEGYRPVSIIETTRVGVEYAGDDAQLKWRFYDPQSIFISIK